MKQEGTLVGGKYLLSRLLGRGAAAEVWAAVNESTGGQVALKLLRCPGEEPRHRLLREARACGVVRHRNVVAVHDVGVADDGEPFLVMELLSGETLADLLRRGEPLSPGRAARIARDVARGLDAACRAGVVHRDLSLANVFLHREEGSDDVVVKLLGLGALDPYAPAPAGPGVLDGDDAPTMQWDRGALHTLHLLACEVPVDPLDAPTISRGAPLGGLLGLSAPTAASTRPSPAHRRWIVAAIALGAVTLALTGASLFRALAASPPPPAIPADVVTAAEPPPFESASQVVAIPPDTPPPAGSARPPAPRPGPVGASSKPPSPRPDIVSREAPRSARSTRGDGGEKTAGPPAWLKKALTSR